MKSVTFSEVVRVAGAPASSSAARYALTMALGMPALMAAFHLLDPSAPLPWIVLPVLAGGLAPMLAVLPGRFEVTTRFEAQLLARTLDATLTSLGYAEAGRQRGAVRYRTSGARWLDREVVVTVREHSIVVVGPVPTLRALQARLAR